jgi:hypothetical protein
MSAMAKTSEKKWKTSSYLILFGVIVVLAGAAFLANKKYHLWDKYFKAHATLEANVQNVDSLQMVKKEGIKKFVIEFLTTIKIDRSLNKYYADEVQRCYLKNNLTLNDVIREKKYFKKRHPRAKVILNQSSIKIDFINANTAEVFANAIYYADSLKNSKEIIYHLKIDKNTKVFYINNPEPGK